MDEFYIIYDDEGKSTAVFRKSKVDGIMLGLGDSGHRFLSATLV